MKLPILRLLWLLSAAAASAATHAVLPGEAIQPKIDAAAPGDIIAIFGGTYPGDVTINKAVRLVEVDGQEVTITGNVTWNGVTNAPPFEGFTVGSAGKGITVNNTTGLVIKNVDARAGSGLAVLGASRAATLGALISSVNHDGGELTLETTQVNGTLTATSNSQKLTCLKLTVAGHASCNSSRIWMGYSSFSTALFGGTNGLCVIVGCSFNGNGTYGDVIDFSGNSKKCLLVNSTIIGARYGGQGGPGANVYPGRGSVRVQSNNIAMIYNNYMSATQYNTYGAYHVGGSLGYAILVDSSSSALVFNNIFEGHYNVLKMPFGCKVNNNLFNAVAGQVYNGGVVPEGSVFGNPLFVASQFPLLQPSSPCVNAGIIDPIFNDLDGSRNDIGPRGGCLFDPDGWTTNKPVVISFDLAPQQLLKGVDTQVTISNGQAVAQP